MHKVLVIAIVLVIIFLVTWDTRAAGSHQLVFPLMHRWIPLQMKAGTPMPTLAPDCSFLQRTPVRGDGWTGYICPGWQAPPTRTITPTPVGWPWPTVTPVTYPGPR